MFTLLVTVFFVVLISAVCSMTESALYSVPWTHIEQLRKKGSPTGELLFLLRSRIDQPIAAVLTLNTVANTAGAAIAGSIHAAAKIHMSRAQQTKTSSREATMFTTF